MSLDIDGTANGEKLSSETLDQLFSQLKAEHIEQFYMAYQLWSQRQQIEQLQTQMFSLQQKINENAAHMLEFQPSAIAMASLAQLQAYGVEDADLLDKLLERGEEWLDHSIELLERCEQLDLIGGNYTQWCQHALEGAYDWLGSMTDPSDQATTVMDELVQKHTSIDEAGATEEQLLKMLMSEDGEVEKLVQDAASEQKPRITQPLTIVDEQDNTVDETQKVAVVNPRKPITQPLSPIDELVISDSQIDIEEETQQVAIVKPIAQSLPSTDEPVVADTHIDTTHTAEETQQVAIVKPTTKPLPSIDGPALPDEQAKTPSSELIVATQEQNLILDHTITIENHQKEHVDDKDAEQPIQSGSEEISAQEHKQQVILPDPPALKKKVTKKKQGFLRWLLAKILRR